MILNYFPKRFFVDVLLLYVYQDNISRRHIFRGPLFRTAPVHIILGDVGAHKQNDTYLAHTLIH